jgi:hypothetical protein
VVVLGGSVLGGAVLAGAALAGTGLGNKNVNVDPRTSFPGGTGPSRTDGSLAVQVGGQLGRSTMTDHPATEDNAAGWANTTTPPGAGRVGGTGGYSRR